MLYYDFDVTNVQPLSSDGNEFHLNFTEPDGSPCRDFDKSLQEKFVLKNWMLTGVLKSGSFVDYVNNRRRVYTKNGRFSVSVFSRRSELISQLVDDFPQFERSYIEICLDNAIKLNRDPDKEKPLWPVNFWYMCMPIEIIKVQVTSKFFSANWLNFKSVFCCTFVLLISNK